MIIIIVEVLHDLFSGPKHVAINMFKIHYIYTILAYLNLKLKWACFIKIVYRPSVSKLFTILFDNLLGEGDLKF